MKKEVSQNKFLTLERLQHIDDKIYEPRKHRNGFFYAGYDVTINEGKLLRTRISEYVIRKEVTKTNVTIYAFKGELELENSSSDSKIGKKSC